MGPLQKYRDLVAGGAIAPMTGSTIACGWKRLQATVRAFANPRPWKAKRFARALLRQEPRPAVGPETSDAKAYTCMARRGAGKSMLMDLFF